MERTGKKFVPPKAHNEIHSRPATVTNSGRRAAKHVPRLSPHSPASIDPGFVKIGLVQLSQSVKTPNVKHAHWQTRRQTDQLNNGTMYAPRYEEAFSHMDKKRPHYEEAYLPKGKIRPRSLRFFGLASL